MKIGSQYLITEVDLDDAMAGAVPPVASGYRTGESATPYGVGEAVPGERQLTVSEADVVAAIRRSRDEH